MPLTLDWDTTTTRAIIIALLLFLQALAIPMLSHLLGEKAFPDLVEFAGYLLAAMLILITYFLTFLKYKGTEE